ncbi:MAG: DUF3109 family protein [Balneolaceae bacterium]
MFRVGQTLLSEEVATAKFACDVSRCKGACCVVGNAGAPLAREEIPALRKAWRLLAGEVREEAREEVERDGLVRGDDANGFEVACVDGKECVFALFDERGVATCAIQRAWQRGRISWEKPVSCHLYPLRLKRIAGQDYANFEYIPSLCSAGCSHGEEKGVWLSGFLERPLERRYGREWVEEFQRACEEIREQNRSIREEV